MNEALRDLPAGLPGSMPELPNFPAPQPDELDAPFWEYVRAGRLHFQWCEDCTRFTHPPTRHCAHCGSTRRAWHAAPAAGTLYSYTIARTVAHESARGHVPYAIVLVEFPGCDGARLIGNVPGLPLADLKIGMTLEWFVAGAETPNACVRFRV